MRYATCVLLLLCTALSADTTQPKSIPGTSLPIDIDGIIQEQAWEESLIIESFIEIQPGENVPPPVRTTGFLTHDEQNFYLAFRCEDPEPDKIRARYADRDRAWADDFVGIMLDTFNDQRYGLEFFVNPLGAQMDLTRREPGIEDSSWDAIWDSAGRITDTGYEVEAAIPFKSLRFPNAEIQTWRFLLFRVYPRAFRHQISSMPFDRDKNCFFCQVDLFTGMKGILPGRNLELVPTLVASESSFREDIGLPMEEDSDAEVGFSSTWGITPNLTLNATLNPDFSQVESDTLQIDVNNRFSLFYSEKRPFFLEGQDYFTTFFSTIHTRTIADPTWGIKFTGKEGPNAFAFFAAEDDLTNILIPGSQGSALFTWDHPSTAGAFRYRRDIGRDSTLGILYTSRSGGDFQSQLYGADGRFRLGTNDFLNFQVLQSQTDYPEDTETSLHLDGSRISGEAFYVQYEHSTRDWYWALSYSDKDPRFRADLGFITRVDSKSGSGFLSYTIYGDGNRFYESLSPRLYAGRTTDHDGTMTDWYGIVELSANLLRQTNGQVGFETNMERYNGTEYRKDNAYLWFNSRFSKSMTSYFSINYGDGIDYENERLGKSINIHHQFDVRFGKRIFFDYNLHWQRLNLGQGELYSATAYYLKSLYHFSNNLFFRAIIQYLDVSRNPSLYLEEVNARDRTLTTQLLFTYKINPVTLVYLGYSDFGIEKDTLDRTTMNRTLFLKLSYAFRP